MPKRLDLGRYRLRIVEGTDINAVSLDEECEGHVLATEVHADFGRLHRCDFYKVLHRGEAKELVLIEKTALDQSANRELERFKASLDEFSRELYSTDVRGLYEQINEGVPYQMFWDFIFRGLWEEHAAKVQASLLILEQMHQRGIDRDLSSVLSYAKIHYILVATIQDENPTATMERVIEGIKDRLGATLVSTGCFLPAMGTDAEIGEKLQEAWAILDH